MGLAGFGKTVIELCLLLIGSATAGYLVGRATTLAAVGFLIAGTAFVRPLERNAPLVSPVLRPVRQPGLRRHLQPSCHRRTEADPERGAVALRSQWPCLASLAGSDKVPYSYRTARR
ncbi:hypothetical protein [Natrinema sp. 1APR25-10V2]|uniref:hypothetical protein n=1 Tax=Natrinema sp. 1APR25-10V2 TaxID=2951081 RepID=UPI00287B6F5E|nr:hypothetical protein [Natrinema sp. 1APR25-10V2]